MKAESVSILVTGDFIIDHHIYEGSRYHYGDSAPGVNVTQQVGGAGVVAGLLREIPGLGGCVCCEREMPEGACDANISHHAYAFWRPMPEEGPPENRFWRCKEAMGFGDRPLNQDGHDQPPCACWPKHKQVPERPSIIVISEGGMGFRDTKLCWEPLAFDAASLIILKTTAPLGTGDLWNKLSSEHRRKLMVVVAADEVRKSSARVSAGLSWEATFQDLLREVAASGRLAKLSQCRHLIVTFGSEGAAWFDLQAGSTAPGTAPSEARVCFVYRAGSIENDHAYSTVGTAFGFLTCVTAALARTAALSLAAADAPGAMASVDCGFAIEAGLAAMHDLRENGHGPATEKPDGFPFKRLAAVICNPDVCYTRASLTWKEAARTLASSKATFLALTRHEANHDAREPAWGFARLVAIHGPIALENLPHLRLGKFVTADRGEVESLRTLAQVIRRYVRHDAGKKPLSIGVFGPPGAGKSFAVKELARAFLGDEAVWLEFNLSQFASPDEINGAFHQVRDQVLQGKLPVAFFDEFDSRRYEWLQYLLAPMQDGRFQQGQLTHTLGKSIFVFAGGTSWSFDTFGPPELKPGMPSESEAARRFLEFRLAKGPDFKSRLDAFIDVAGPNHRAKPAPAEATACDFEVSGHRLVEDDEDIWFPIRRALILRVDLGLAPEQRLQIDPGLLHALLHVQGYTHGSRSLSKILTPLATALPAPLQPSHLPPHGQLAMHCNADEFRHLCQGAKLPPEFEPEALPEQAVNVFAPAIHDTYNELGLRTGSLKPDKVQSLAEYAIENPFKGASNYAAARRIPGILALVGLRLETGCATPDEQRRVRQHLEYHLELLANAEHQGWMQWHFDNGWTYHPKRDDKQRRHNCLKPFTQLKETDRTKDREQVRHFPDFADKAGFKIVFV